MIGHVTITEWTCSIMIQSKQLRLSNCDWGQLGEIALLSARSAPDMSVTWWCLKKIDLLNIAGISISLLGWNEMKSLEWASHEGVTASKRWVDVLLSLIWWTPKVHHMDISSSFSVCCISVLTGCCYISSALQILSFNRILCEKYTIIAI